MQLKVQFNLRHEQVQFNLILNSNKSFEKISAIHAWQNIFKLGNANIDK